MQSKEVQSWQDQTALTRYGLIAPLLDETLDIAAKTKLRGEISDRTGVSTRTIYRYEKQFASDGFQELKPQSKQHSYSKQLPENFPELLEQAIQLKKEVPKRSVAKIIWILASEFYDNQEELIVEDTFRKAILLHGKFDACYFDNGSQYVAKQLKLSLGKLGIPIRYARPRSGKSKGKVEKFHQVVDSFLREVKLQRVKTLDEFNRYWKIYLQEAYQNYPNDGIAEYYKSLNASVPDEGITPVQEWNRDTRSLTYLDTAVVTEAFLHHEYRNVDKGACISFRGRRYETKPSLIGYKVEISYDPKSPEIITVYHEGILPFTASPVKIGAFCDKNPTLPASMQTIVAMQRDSSKRKWKSSVVYRRKK